MPKYKITSTIEEFIEASDEDEAKNIFFEDIESVFSSPVLNGFLFISGFEINTNK